MLANRDAAEIVKFLESADELFFLFQKADYPLRPDVLVNEAKKRLYTTVVFFEGTLTGYGNFIKASIANPQI